MTDHASTLCTHCGLCCDGTLFAWVKLEGPAEAEALRAAGLEVGNREDGSLAVHQCCAALRGRSCTVYDLRPAACRRFRCNLLIAVDEGEVGVDEALATIAETHAAIAEVGTALQRREPLVAGGEVLPETRHEAETAATHARDRVEALLKRHFLGRQG